MPAFNFVALVETNLKNTAKWISVIKEYRFFCVIRMALKVYQIIQRDFLWKKCIQLSLNGINRLDSIEGNTNEFEHRMKHREYTGWGGGND
jgi:hypothetical protein